MSIPNSQILEKAFQKFCLKWTVNVLGRDGGKKWRKPRFPYEMDHLWMGEPCYQKQEQILSLINWWRFPNWVPFSQATAAISHQKNSQIKNYLMRVKLRWEMCQSPRRGWIFFKLRTPILLLNSGISTQEVPQPELKRSGSPNTWTMYLPLCLTYFSFLVNSRLSTITCGHGLDRQWTQAWELSFSKQKCLVHPMFVYYSYKNLISQYLLANPYHHSPISRKNWLKN